MAGGPGAQGVRVQGPSGAGKPLPVKAVHHVPRRQEQEPINFAMKDPTGKTIKVRMLDGDKIKTVIDKFELASGDFRPKYLKLGQQILQDHNTLADVWRIKLTEEANSAKRALEAKEMVAARDADAAANAFTGQGSGSRDRSRSR